METIQVVFVCCDMGETNALLPVINKISEKSKDTNEKSFDVKIIAMGAAINKLQTEASLKESVIEVKESVNTAIDRSKPLENVAEIIQNLQPLVVISGPASKAQEQLLHELKAKKKIVYLDNFNYATENPTFATARGVVQEANRVICVSDIVKQQMLSVENGALREKDFKVLGRPSLESWVHQVNNVNKADAVAKIQFDATKPIVTFIGGYGPRYDEGVNVAYENAVEVLERNGFQVHVQHHPNVVRQQPLTTIEAVGMADWIVCYDSTVGFEALFAGKKVIYLQPEDVAPYDNIAIEKKLATRVRNNEELLEALTTERESLQDIYEVLGVKRNSTEAIIGYVLKKIKNG